MQKDKQQWVNEFKRRLYSFALKLIAFIDGLAKDRVCFIIGDQLLRSGTSILGNYVEALSSSSRREFARYFDNTLRSINESKMWLGLLRDSNRAPREVVEWFLKELDEYGKLIGSSLLTLKGKRQGNV